MFVADDILNEHGFEMPSLPNLSYDMMSDDNFMVRKLDEIIVGGGGHVYMRHLSDESNVEVRMFNQSIWSGSQLPLNIEYFVGSDKQPGIRGHDGEGYDGHLVSLSLEELCNLE